MQDKKDAKGRTLPVKTMTFREESSKEHLAEKQMKEFSKVHVDKNTKYKEGAKRILLNASMSSTLFDANIGYHYECYQNFRAPAWKKFPDPNENVERNEKSFLHEFVGVTEYLIAVKREVYTIRQLRDLFSTIKGVGVESVRGIDVRGILEDHLKDKVQFCVPTCTSSGHGMQSEYVMSSDSNILSDAIQSIVTGQGISNYKQLKSLGHSISLEIQSRESIPWPPTPQDVIDSQKDLDLNRKLFNLIAWVVSPNAAMDKNGFVKLSSRKEIKVNEIVQNIQALVPGSKPGLNQILLSLNTLSKTGSSMIVNDLKQLGHGISNTEAMFIQDKWAEWTDNVSTVIPSNIKKGVITTHIFDNIDWKNKSISRQESHHTNSILVQKDNYLERLSNISIEPSYNFSRKDHRSYKGSDEVLPNFYLRRGPVKLLDYSPVEGRENSLESSLHTLAWVYSRINAEKQTMPSWSGFKELVSTCDPEIINVGYLPPIPFPPTDDRVIAAEIRRTESIRKELGIDFIFIEADQAIYTKVLDVMFFLKGKGEDLFPTIIPRMGGFHIGMSMLRTIYTVFKGCGIIQLLSSAGLGGLGSIKKALTGGDVKEGINLHKKLFEAFLRSKLEFLGYDSIAASEEALSAIDNLRRHINKDNFEIFLQDGGVKLLQKNDGNDMGRLVDLYIEMVDMLLNFNHFLRIGNWDGYLEVLFEFLPYCFRFNRNKYARNLSYYYVHMTALKEDNSEAYAYLQNGGFSGSLTGKPHSRIPFDQVIEMTINRSCKDVGGLSGKTQNTGASQRWAKINHHIVALREYHNQRIRKKTSTKHVDLGSNRIKRDEIDVKNILSCIDTWLPNFWRSGHPVTNFATGEIATDEMKTDLNDIKERGETARDEFIERFTKADSPLSYYDPIKKQKFNLFEKKKSENKQSIPEDEGQSFTEVLATFDQRKLDLRSIMDYCVTSKPWAIVNENEKSRESNKYLLRNYLQNICPVPKKYTLPDTSASIVDAMRVVRMIGIGNLKPHTYRSWANQIKGYLDSLPGNSLHVIFDDYSYEHSVPSKQRNVTHIERVINSLDQDLPPLKEWNDFLMNSKNKLQLVNMLVEFSKTVLSKSEVFINKGSVCYIVKDNICQRIPELDSKHREADQKIPFHVVYAGKNSEETICVVADDSDIYFSLIYISSHVQSNLYFRQGKAKDKDGITYHDVQAIASYLEEDICQIILAFHDLTGGDFTNPFYRRSKVQAFKKMLKSPHSPKWLISLSSRDPDIEEVTKFVMQII